MEFIKIFGIIAIGLTFCVVLKVLDSKMAVWVSVATVIVVLLYSVKALEPVVELVNSLSKKVDGGSGIVAIMLKVSMVNIVSYVLSILCSECGEKSLVSVIGVVSDVICLLLVVPMLGSIYDAVIDLLGG